MGSIISKKYPVANVEQLLQIRDLVATQVSSACLYAGFVQDHDTIWEGTIVHHAKFRGLSDYVGQGTYSIHACTTINLPEIGVDEWKLQFIYTYAKSPFFCPTDDETIRKILAFADKPEKKAEFLSRLMIILRRKA
jgi:hypothetical protein